MSKISLSPDASGTGIFTIASPNSNTNRTLTLPDETGTVVTTGTTTGISASAISTGTLAAARLPAGSVLQVVSAINTTQFTTTSTSFVTTGFSASITPSSASNKIIVMFSSYPDSVATARAIHWTLYRGATNLGNATGGISVMYNDTGRLIGSLSYTYIDSPNTTSSVTYTSYIKSPSGGSVNIPYVTNPETFILMEIAA